MKIYKKKVIFEKLSENSLFLRLDIYIKTDILSWLSKII